MKARSTFLARVFHVKAMKLRSSTSLRRSSLSHVSDFMTCPSFFKRFHCIENSELFQWRGRTLMALGKFTEAIYDFTWAIRLEQQNM